MIVGGWELYYLQKAVCSFFLPPLFRYLAAIFSHPGWWFFWPGASDFFFLFRKFSCMVGARGHTQTLKAKKSLVPYGAGGRRCGSGPPFGWDPLVSPCQRQREARPRPASFVELLLFYHVVPQQRQPSEKLPLLARPPDALLESWGKIIFNF